MPTISTVVFYFSIFALVQAVPLGKNHIVNLRFSSQAPLPDLIPSISVRLPQDCSTGGPCHLRDEECMSNQMLKYVNDYRKSQGLSKMLSSGSSSQLNNAMGHSKKMKQNGSIYHQKLSRVNLGCSAFFSGENVAKNHCIYGKTNTDPARMCVDQFIESEPHRLNLINENHESVAMGVYISNDGYIWCTQTFTKSTKFSTSGTCAPVKSTSSSLAAGENTKPKPLNSVVEPQSNEPAPGDDPCDSFKTKEFQGRVQGNGGRPKKFTAMPKGGVCQYCTSRDLCLDADYSRHIDDQLNA